MASCSHQRHGAAIKGFSCLLACLIQGVAWLCGDASVAAPEAASDEVVKMAMVYNIGKFVDWPKPAAAGVPLVLCVAGHSQRLAQGLAAIDGKLIHGRPLQVQRNMDSNGYDSCQILFFADPLTANELSLLPVAQQHGVLTISDDEQFSKRGGLFELVTQEQHVRFAVNLTAAKHAGFQVHAELLRLAESVIGASPP